MRQAQAFFMLLLTVAIGAVFLIRIPSPQGDRIVALETTVARQNATINFYERQPTQPPLTVAPPTTAPDAGNALGVTAAPQSDTAGGAVPQSGAAGLSGSGPTPLPTFDIGAGNPTGGRIADLQASTDVNFEGCAINPRASFLPTDSIYGVAYLVDMEQGDQLSVRFEMTDSGQVIYEDFFVIEEGGSYCRWYIIEPDAAGWAEGGYSITYQVNDGQPFSINYTVSTTAGQAPLDALQGDDTMTDDMMMDDDAP